MLSSISAEDGAFFKDESIWSCYIVIAWKIGSSWNIFKTDELRRMNGNFVSTVLKIKGSSNVSSSYL